MAPSRVTLRDVALKVGVHPSTVSRVLNASTRSMVSPEIAERVEEAARDLGYRPNPIAYGLKTRRSLTVGVVIPDLTDPLFPPIIRGIDDILAGAGYTTIVANTDNDRARERVILERMRERHVDALILGSTRREDALDDIEVPVVLINRSIDGGGVAAVISDNAGGIGQVVDHLVSLGHRDIAHVAGPQFVTTGVARAQAFRSKLESLGLPQNEALIVHSQSYSREEGRRALARLLQSRERLTAVIAANDLLALGCYDALTAEGLRCPRDVSVTGFNDMPFVDMVNPPLTTVRIPQYDMGAAAARAVLGRMSGTACESEMIVLPSELVVRASTAPPRDDRAAGGEG
jgi:LacI family transcriptional regulator